MAVAGNTPTASFLTKIGKMKSAGCRLCRIAREDRGESTDGMAAETHGHINSAGCEEGKKDKLFADHVTQVCEAHNRVTVSFLQQVQGGTRPTTEGSRENIGHSVHV